MKIIIIEDEKPIAKDLARTLQKVDPSIEIVASLHSVSTAVEYFEQAVEVDLIFSDIQLGDGLSFEIFPHLQTQPPVIFCTAYNEYALKAFEANGIDYVLKPFGQVSIRKALDKYHSLKSRFSASQNDFSDLMAMLQTQSNRPSPESILLHQGDKIVPLGIKEIALFYVEDRYTFAYTFEGKKHIVSQKLEQLETITGDRFFRANRQFLVNRKAIRDASHFFNRKLLINLNLNFSEQITVGKVKTPDFLQWLASVD